MNLSIGKLSTTADSSNVNDSAKKKFMKSSIADKFSYLYDEIEKLKAYHQEEPEPTEPTDPTPEPNEPITYTFESFGDAEGNTSYGTGKVQLLEDTITINEEEYRKVKVIENTVEDWVNEEFYILSTGEAGQLYQLVNTNGEFIPVWVRYQRYTGENDEQLAQQGPQA